MKKLIAGLVLLPGLAWAQEAELAPGTVIQDCDDCPELVVIPPGNFLMGTEVNAREVQMDRGEGPRVPITIDYKFLMGRTEVTHGQFKEFADETGYPARGGCRVWDGEFDERDDATWRNPYQPKRPRDDHPVGCVSWEDAQAYVDWLSEKAGVPYRLPTEAEWEYAGRAGTETPRFWGNSANQACEWANTFDIDAAEEYPFPWYPAACRDGYADLAPVASFKPNAFGLYDMIGNVWEWSQDCFAPTHVGRPNDGSAWEWGNGGCQQRTVRGGAWMTAPERNRVAWPGRDPQKRLMGYFGFRVARDVDAKFEPAEDFLRAISIITADMDRAKQFWTEALGYEVINEVTGFRGPNMSDHMKVNEIATADTTTLAAGGDRPRITLVRINDQELETLNKQPGQPPFIHDHFINFLVRDVDHVHDVAEDMGLNIVHEPEDFEFNDVRGRSFIMWGPDLTRITITQLFN